MSYTRLSPPSINATIPAFCAIDGNITLKVPFILNKAVGEGQFNKISIIIKTVSTGAQKLIMDTAQYYYDYNKRHYIAVFDITNHNKINQRFETKQFHPIVGQYYKLQIACTYNDQIGYYSTIGVVKFTSSPAVFFKGREAGTNKTNTYDYVGVYSQKDGDITEKVYSYKFDLYNNQKELIETSGEQLHNSSTDTEIYQSTDTWTLTKSLIPNQPYIIKYTITTMNGLVVESKESEIIEVNLEEPNMHADLSAVAYPEDGYIELSLLGHDDNVYVNGAFILLRQSSEDNYNTWNEITRFRLSRWWSGDKLDICRDHSIAQGVSYRYAVQAYNSVGTHSNRCLNLEGPVVCDFEDAFLYDGEKQLKIKFNPKVTNLKSTVLETKTNTIGGKYPFIFRNGNVEYKEFSISGLLSLLSDNNNCFKSNLYESGDGARAAAGFVEASSAQLTGENYRKEREFKLEVMEWLNNGKPKLFRSAAEGNYIIRLMNVSLTPNDTLGRMLHTFNAQACEIAEFNYENLKKYNFTAPGYVETRSLQMGTFGYDSKIIETNLWVPNAVMLNITDAPGTLIKVRTASNQVYGIEVGSNGTYVFNESVLREDPVVCISLSSDSWNNCKIIYGYYDESYDEFSLIHQITPKDQILQYIGNTGVNLIPKLEDVRTKTGMFHYIRVQPRERRTIYYRNGYFYNHDNNSQVSFEDNYIYLIKNPDGEITQFIDGRDGIAQDLSNLSYRFKMGGSDSADFSLINENPTTSGAYRALTNISSLEYLQADNGLIVDIVYQQNELLYVVEVQQANNPYRDDMVISTKYSWQNLIDTGASAAAINQAYNIYINTLKHSLTSLKNKGDFNVDFAI